MYHKVNTLETRGIYPRNANLVQLSYFNQTNSPNQQEEEKKNNHLKR